MVENFWVGKKILVTGGDGFLGSHLLKELKSKGCNLFAPRRQDFDLRKISDVKRLVSMAGEIDVLFHLAANVGGIGHNQKYPYDLFYDNVVMGINLIDRFQDYAKKFIQIGTTCSYPNFCPMPFCEKDVWAGYPEPTNAPYGIAKRVLLAQLQAARKQYGFNGIYVIPTNLYGPGDNFSDSKSHVIPALIKKIVKAKSVIDVWGTGNATRDFLYVKDAVRGIMLAAEKYNEPEPVNLGSGKQVTIAELVIIIKQLVGSNAKIIWQPDRPDGQLARLLDNSKATRTFGWKPETSLHSGLDKTIEWYKENIYAKN